MKDFSKASARALATGLYSGLSPKAPGTAGSICFAVIWALLGLGSLPVWMQIGVVSVVIAAGTWSTAVCLRTFYAGQSDPQMIVVDEWAGLALTYLIAGSGDLESIVYGLIAFRVFDILKPPPVRTLERLPGAYGIMVDDLAAGVFAGLAVVALSVAIG